MLTGLAMEILSQLVLGVLEHLLLLLSELVASAIDVEI
jgi:hypothetical protein